MGRPTIVAHRGLSGTVPENTLPAFDAAIDAGADGVETDVQRTADGHLVLLHDHTPARTTDVAQVFPDRAEEPVGAFTLAELRNLDAGSWKAPQWAGTAIPTLEELLTLLDGRDARLYLEFKSPELYDGIEEQVLTALRAHGMLRGDGDDSADRDGADRDGADRERVKFESFDASSLARVQQLHPHCETGLAFLDRPEDLAGVAWVTSVNIRQRHVDETLVAETRAHGLELTVWTIDKPRRVKRYADLGVTTITTNRADLAVSVLA